MRWARGRWSPVAILIAIAIIAVSVLLYRATPGPSTLRAAYTERGHDTVEIGSITVTEPSLTVAQTAEFDGDVCPEDGVFLIFTATYQFRDIGNLPDRGLELDGKRYLPSGCQDDFANDAPVSGEWYTLDTVFVIDEGTWQHSSGDEAEVRVTYRDPWYQYLGTVAIIQIEVPDEIVDHVEAQARR